MPRIFTDSLTEKQVQTLLLELQQGPFAALPENQFFFPLDKGIYFWYMKPEGYQLLSQYVPNLTSFNSSTLELNGSLLVYLGTAGTRKTEDNKTGLRNRFVWHVCNQHTASQVKNSSLSTLRQTLGALLSDDLILGIDMPTEKVVNIFMANYLQLTYISYIGVFEDVCLSIDEDETKLIKILKPLLNLRNNPNCQQIGHPTCLIKARRKVVINRTKARLS